jgi:Holliday junction resolvase RusA-like endonuclease
MTVTITIDGTLPGANEYINAERSNRYLAATMKRETQELIAAIARMETHGIVFEKPVKIAYRWVEPNRKRDLDNIAFARKFVQDALVSAGILTGDGWAQIVGFADEFAVDKEWPRVEITIEEVESCAD